jgi:hypothetical protein
MAQRETRGGHNVNIRNEDGENKLIKYNKSEFNRNFPLDDWTLASGRVLYTERGEFASFDTDIYTSSERWRTCQYQNPTFEELQNPKVRKAVRDWYRDCNGTDQIFTPADAKRNSKRLTAYQPPVNPERQVETSGNKDKVKTPNPNSGDKEGEPKSKRGEKRAPNPNRGDKEGDSRDPNPNKGDKEGYSKASPKKERN